MPAERVAEPEAAEHGGEPIGQHEQGLRPGKRRGWSAFGDIGHNAPAGQQVNDHHLDEHLDEQRIRGQDRLHGGWVGQR